MIITLLIIGVIAAVCFSGFYSGSETGLYCVNRLRVRVRADRGDLCAQRLARLLDDDRGALSTLLIGTNVANYLATITVASVLLRTMDVGPGKSEVYTTLIVTPVIFVFGEVVPKNLFQRDADRLMFLGTRLFQLSAWLFRLPVMAINWIAGVIIGAVTTGPVADVTDPRRRVAILLQEALAAEDAESEHRELVGRVLELRDLAVHQVMVPRNRVVMIHGGAQRKDVLSLARKQAHARFPVYEDQPRRIQGFVHLHELLGDDSWQAVRERIHPIVNVHPHDSVSAAVVRLQAAKQPLAAVVDRSGYLLGLVTLNDLLSELVGEL